MSTSLRSSDASVTMLKLVSPSRQAYVLAETKPFIDHALCDGSNPTSGTAIIKTLPPASILSVAGSHSEEKQRVGRRSEFSERFSSLTSRGGRG